jgi:hypothetical protein
VRYLLLSEKGWGSVLLSRLEDEGHQVSLYCRNVPTWRKGFYPTYRNLEKALREEKPEVVLVDSCSLVSEVSQVKEKGIPVLGSPLAHTIDTDFPMVMKNLERAGVKTVPWERSQKPNLDERLPILARLRISEDREWIFDIKPEDIKRIFSGDLPVKEVVFQNLPIGPLFTVWGFFNSRRKWEDLFILQTDRRSKEDYCCIESVSIGQIPSDSPLLKVTLRKSSQLLKVTDYVGPVGMNCGFGEAGEVLVWEMVLGWRPVTTEAFAFSYLGNFSSFLDGLLGRSQSVSSLSIDPVKGNKVFLSPMVRVPWVPEEVEADLLPILNLPVSGFPASPPEKDGMLMVWGQVGMRKGSLVTSGPEVGVLVFSEEVSEKPELTLPRARIAQDPLYSIGEVKETLRKSKLLMEERRGYAAEILVQQISISGLPS